MRRGYDKVSYDKLGEDNDHLNCLLTEARHLKNYYHDQLQRPGTLRRVIP